MIIGIDASRAFGENRGGPEYYTYHLIKNISKLDKENKYILYIRNNQKKEIDFPLPGNFRVEEINLPYLWTQVGLAQKAIFGNLDLLFVPAHTLPVIARITRRRLPIIVTIHGLEGKYLPNAEKLYTHIYRNWSISWSVKMATHLIAVSNYTKQEVIKHYKVSKKNKEKITVIHEGVAEKFFRTDSKGEKTKTKKVLDKYGVTKPYLLFVGTVQPRKNLIRLIKAFSLFQKQCKNTYPERANFGKKIQGNKVDTKYNKLELIIAGKLGWLYQNIIKAPKKYQVENSVKFIGRVDDNDLPYLYFGAKAFIIPSITEGFGLPVLEAQAAGIPAIATNKGAPKEVSGGAALFIEPTSTTDIKNAIKKILSKNLREELVAKGKNNAQNMSWKQTAHNTIELFAKIIAGKE